MGRRIQDERRSVASRLGEMAGWPVAAGLAGLLWLNRSWPRRVPNLLRLTRSPRFGQLQSAAAAWLDQCFELIEDGVPGLDRAGSWVCDRCFTSWASSGAWISIPRDPPVVGCERVVTTVYGFDGSLRDGLAELAAALAAAGWGQDGWGGDWIPLQDLSAREPRHHYPDPPVPHSEPPVWPGRFRPVPALGVPPGLELATLHAYRWGSGWLDMGLGWVSRGEPARLRTTRGMDWPGDNGLAISKSDIRRLGWPADLRTANAVYRPLEIGGTDVDRLTARVLARHQHGVAIRIKIHYYPNTATQHDRLRKRRLPVW